MSSKVLAALEPRGMLALAAKATLQGVEKARSVGHKDSTLVELVEALLSTM